MPTIIEQIQLDAINPALPVSSLLRRVKFASAKLDLSQVEHWVEQELNGYDSAVPDYRMLYGQPRAYHPLQGWVPIAGRIEPLSRKGNGQSIAQIEEIISDGSPEAYITYPDVVTKHLNEQNGMTLQYALFIQRNSLVAVLDKVRNLVLDWALKLQKAGITGTEFSFSPEDRAKAQEASSMNVSIGTLGSLVGNLGFGNVSGDINASNISVNEVRGLLAQVRQFKDALILAGVSQTRLDQCTSAIEGELENATSDQGRLRGLVSDLRNTVSGAAGNLVASGVIAIANQILGTGVPAS